MSIWFLAYACLSVPPEIVSEDEVEALVAAEVEAVLGTLPTESCETCSTEVGDVMLRLDAAESSLSALEGQVAALESAALSKVYAAYETNLAATNLLVSANTTVRVDFNAEQADADGTVTTGTAWHFDAPRDGFFRVSTSVQLVGTTAGRHILRIHGGGVRRAVFDQQASPDDGGVLMHGSYTFDLADGDDVFVEVFVESGGTIQGVAGVDGSWVVIESVDG